jgi:hemolysin activation/secretion protein
MVHTVTVRQAGLLFCVCMSIIAWELQQTSQAQLSTPQLQQQPGAIIQHLENPDTGKPRPISPADDTRRKDLAQPPAPAIKTELPDLKIDDSLKRKLHINEIKVEGATKLTAEDISAVTKPYLNSDVSFVELQEKVADKLSDIYEKRGYITTSVFIPPQKIENGIITVQVAEGRISQVLIQENRWFKPRAITPRVGLKPGDVFNVKPLEKGLRRINENPDIVLQATLKAGEKLGETEIVLTPRRETFFAHLTPFIDNLGRPVIGNTRYGFTMANNNALGLGDTLFSSPYWTRRSFGIINGYELPLGRFGTKIGFVNALTRYKLNSNGFELHGNSMINTPYISQELYRSDRAILTAELGLAIKNSGFQIDGHEIGQTRLRVLTPALNLQTFDRWGRSYMRHEFGFGLNMANATQRGDANSSNPQAGSKFFRYTVSASRLQVLPHGTYGILKVQGQASPSHLFSLEQMQIGGASTVRGYQEGRLIGNKGFMTSAEWRIPLRFLPDQFKIGKYVLSKNVELASFLDAGGVFDNHSALGVNQKSGRVQSRGFLLGTGVGLRFKLTEMLSARVDVGFPLIRQNPDQNAARVHFGVETRLF